MLRQASQPEGQFAIDFGDYHGAARALVETGSPYAAEMLAGPVDAQGLERYRYPPPLAQLLAPLSVLALGAAAAIWLDAPGGGDGRGRVAGAGCRRGAASRRAGGLVGRGVSRVHARVRHPLEGQCERLRRTRRDARRDGRRGGRCGCGRRHVAQGGARDVPADAAGGRPASAGGGRHHDRDRRRRLRRCSPRPRGRTTRSCCPNLLGGSADYATNVAPATLLGRAGVPAPLPDLARALSMAGAVALTVAAPLVAQAAPRLPRLGGRHDPGHRRDAAATGRHLVSLPGGAAAGRRARMARRWCPRTPRPDGECRAHHRGCGRPPARDHGGGVAGGRGGRGAPAGAGGAGSPGPGAIVSRASVAGATPGAAIG